MGTAYPYYPQPAVILRDTAIIIKCSDLLSRSRLTFSQGVDKNTIMSLRSEFLLLQNIVECALPRRR